MLLKITENFYQLTDVFTEELFNHLRSIFSQDKSLWDHIADDGTNILRMQYSLNVNDSPSTDIHQQLKPIISLAEERVGKLYQNGPQLWYDADGYINTIHDGDVSPNHCVNVQVYLSDGADNMGTACYDEGSWHRVPYKANCGYMLIGPTKIPHGMQFPVTNERMSLYQGFRNTEIPSDIW